ncbi:hypothetical protein GTS_53490 [Gandjariella thermophila]|uniref:Uncharacterized protein n=1 Tax=Gandjariella thermophila TaxID=1931992 RepID=A0A4D4JH42_9PSEU|nr:hypothetical protein GTS_53490 [Gandjariella thermophila]
MTKPSSAPAGVSVMWVTCVLDGTDHAVTDTAMATGITSDTATWEAVCGTQFVPAPLICPPCPPCPSCVAFVRARATMRDLDQRMTPARHGRHGLLARVLRRRSKPPAVPPSSAPPTRDGRPPLPTASRSGSASSERDRGGTDA